MNAGPRPRWAPLAALLAAGCMVSCSDALGPGAGGIWRGEAGAVPAGQTRVYTFDENGPVLLALYVRGDSTPVTATVQNAAGDVVGQAASIGAGNSVETPVRVIGSCGCTVTVTADVVNGRSAGAAYDVRVLQVDTLPEKVPPTIRLDQPDTGESLGPGLDVDTYNLDATLPMDGMLVLRYRTLAPGPGSTASLVAAGATEPKAQVGPGGWVRTGLAAASYRVVVGFDPAAIPAGTNVPYRLDVYPVNPAPERVAADLPDAPVTGEQLDRPGDIDEFHFSATAGEIFTLDLAAPAASAQGAIQATLLAPDGSAFGPILTVRPDSARGDTAVSAYVTAPVTGVYTVHVDGIDWYAGDSLKYTLDRHRVNAAPEHAPALLVAGDSVTTETLDAPSDIDDYTFRVLPGQPLVSLLFRAAPPVDGADFTVSDATGSVLCHRTLFSTDSLGDCAGLILAPGDYRVEVREMDFGPTNRRFTGAYTIRTAAASLGPEDAPATIRPGDTVTESLARFSDIDTFTLDLAGHSRIALTVDAPNLTGGELEVDVGRPGQAPLRYVGLPSATAPGQPVQIPPFSLPDAGPWQIKVTTQYMAPAQVGGTYRLSVIAADSVP